jgi:hypothetical protein
MSVLFEDYPEGDMQFNVVPSTAYEPGGPWFDVPSTVIMDPRLTVHAKMLMVVLLRAWKLGTKFDDETLAGIMCVNSLTISKYAKELVDVGYVKIQPGKAADGQTLYSLIVDPA